MAQRSTANSTAASPNIAVRFHLHNGETVALSCNRTETFRQIKKKIWIKKKFSSDRRQYVCTLKDSELVFRDSDRFARLVRLAPIFSDANTGKILEAAIVPKADLGDKYKRQIKRPSDDVQYLMQGQLYKRGRTESSAWRARYFVLESYSLFYFENKEAFFEKGEAIDVIPIGNCPAIYAPDVQHKGKNYCFELKADHLGKRDFMLAADSAEELQQWLDAIYGVNFRRVKTITISIIEELERRGFGKHTEGIFRLSGSRELVENIKRAYDSADFPALSEVKDEHALSGVLKMSLRELSDPLLTFARYKDFISLGLMSKEEIKSGLIELIHRLPAANRYFLQYLCKFLYKLSLGHAEHMMTAKNLAIVFAPNILRPQQETVGSTMNDTQPSLAVVQAMIEHYPAIWGAPDDDLEAETPLEEEDSDEEDQLKRSSTEHHRRVLSSSTLSAASIIAPSPSATNSVNHAGLSALVNAALSPRGEQNHNKTASTTSLFSHKSDTKIVDDEDDDDEAAVMQNNPMTTPTSPQQRSLGAKKLPVGMPGISPTMMMHELKQKQQNKTAVQDRATRRSDTEKMLDSCRKQYQTLDQTWDSTLSRYREKIDKSWKLIDETLAAGGIAAQPVLDKLNEALRAHKDSQQAAISTFDDVLSRLTLLAQNMNTTKDPSLATTATSHPNASPTTTTTNTTASHTRLSPSVTLNHVTHPSPATTAHHSHTASTPNIKTASDAASVFGVALRSRTREESHPPPPPPAAEPPAPTHVEASPVPAASTTTQPLPPTSPPPLLAVPSADNPPPPPPPPPAFRKATALYDYTGGHRVDELTFKAGDVIEVIDDSDQAGWWEGRLADKIGWFPGNYVQMIS